MRYANGQFMLGSLRNYLCIGFARMGFVEILVANTLLVQANFTDVRSIRRWGFGRDWGGTFMVGPISIGRV